MRTLTGNSDRRARQINHPRVGQHATLEGRTAGVTIVGGGLAGVSAAIVLAERGAAVVLHEAGDVLGGRLASWPDRLNADAGGEPVTMERGFHAFFRQYYNARNLLRRIDPALRFLRPCDDYPLFGPNGAHESFSGLPRTPPLNLVALIRRTPTLGLRDLVRMDGEAAAEMLAYDGDETYARFDSMSAAEYLDSVGFPDDARRMLFEVFAHSFFNPEASMSAAEMLMMFHLYFCGSAEGILFDVLDEPFGDAVWTPLTRRLHALGVEVRCGSTVDVLEPPTAGEGLVLAADLAGLQRVVRANPWLHGGSDEAEAWAAHLEALTPAPPFVVWRLWLDADVRADRQPFAGTAGLGVIDNISCVHRYQGEAHRWALRAGGSVIELHAYALPETHQHDVERIKRELLSTLHALYPETAAMQLLDDRFLLRSDCPGFTPGSYVHRPTVRTPHQQVVVAGDMVKLPFPTALMERAVTSGMTAANELLASWDVGPEPLWSIPTRGILASLQAWQRSRTRG